MLLRQLHLHPERQRAREHNAALLADLLSDIDGLLLAPADERITAHGLHLVLIRVPSALGRKDRPVEALQAEGVPVTGGYPQGLHHNRAVARMARRNVPDQLIADCPHTDAVAGDTVALAHRQLLADEQAMRDIADAFCKVLGAFDRI